LVKEEYMGARKKTVKLGYPVEFEKAEVSEVEIRSPKVKDYVQAQKAGSSQEETEIILIASLIKKPVEFVEEMEFADYTKLQGELQSFLN
jgi:hypothetical protein